MNRGSVAALDKSGNGQEDGSKVKKKSKNKTSAPVPTRLSPWIDAAGSSTKAGPSPRHSQQNLLSALMHGQVFSSMPDQDSSEGSALPFFRAVFRWIRTAIHVQSLIPCMVLQMTTRGRSYGGM